MSNVKMFLPSVFDRQKADDYDDDGAIFRVWTYKDTVEFDVAFYTDDRNTIYFNFRRPYHYNDRSGLSEETRNLMFAFEHKYMSVTRDKLFGNQAAKDELEELCEIIYREVKG